MLCNRLVSKSKFFAIAAILLVSFLLPAKANAGICYSASGCVTNQTKCYGEDIYDENNTCADVKAAADLMNGDQSKASSEKKGLGALKESADKLIKAGGVTKPLEQVIGGYIRTALVLVGTLFMALTFYGGYIWFIAREDEEEAKRARSIISMALIGLIIVFAAYFVTYFIIYRLTVASGTGLLE